MPPKRSVLAYKEDFVWTSKDAALARARALKQKGYKNVWIKPIGAGAYVVYVSSAEAYERGYE
jgi:hypothetical protein